MIFNEHRLIFETKLDHDFITEMMVNVAPYWLRSFDCYRWEMRNQCTIIDNRYLLMKHSAHPSYGGPTIGSGNCSSYFKLYDFRGIDIEDFKRDIYFRTGFSYGTTENMIQRFEGRWSKAKDQIMIDTIRQRLNVQWQ